MFKSSVKVASMKSAGSGDVLVSRQHVHLFASRAASQVSAVGQWSSCLMPFGTCVASGVSAGPELASRDLAETFSNQFAVYREPVGSDSVTSPALQVVPMLSAGACCLCLVALKNLAGDHNVSQKSAGVFGDNSNLQVTTFSHAFAYGAHGKLPYTCSHVQWAVS